MSQEAHVTPATQSTAPVKSGGSKKTVIIILLILGICVVVAAIIGVALYLVGKKAEKELKNLESEIESTIDDLDELDEQSVAPTAAAGEQVYTSEALEFSIVLPEDWTVNETTEQVEITTPDEDTITVQTFTDAAFDYLTEVDQAFCDSFAEGFSEGLAAYTTETVTFTAFTLNGNSGCKADANLNLIAEISQKYYVLFNTSNNKVYSMFYTTLTDTDDTELVNAMETFDFI